MPVPQYVIDKTAEAFMRAETKDDLVSLGKANAEVFRQLEVDQDEREIMLKGYYLRRLAILKGEPFVERELPKTARGGRMGDQAKGKK